MRSLLMIIIAASMFMFGFSVFQVIYSPYRRNKKLKELGMEKSAAIQEEFRSDTFYFLKTAIASSVVFAICARLI